MAVFYEPPPVAPLPIPPAPDPRAVVVRDGQLIDKKKYDELEKSHEKLKHSEASYFSATIILSIVAAVLLGMFCIAAASCSNVEKKLEARTGRRS